jgi:predicted nucleic acid-binding protein
MTPRCGIDTSVLVRLAVGEPEPDFQHCVEALRVLIEDQGREIFASNQVIGEGYVAIQHHYGVSDADARAALINVLGSGLVAPLNGQAVILALQSPESPGLFDRLIADDYSRVGLETLTLDRRMATLPNVHRL